MIKLQEWFESETRDYGIGLALLGTHCKNRILLQNLARKQNPGKLEYELKKALDRKKELDAEADETEKTKEAEAKGGIKKVVTASVKDVEPLPEKVKIVRNDREVNYDDLPEDIQKLWDENRDAYKEIRALHEKLKLMEKATPEDRQPLTERIATLDEKIRTNWQTIDAWQPGSEPEAKQEPVQIDHKRINANRKYISTNLKKLADEKDEAKAAKLREKIQERVTELVAAGETIGEKTVEELKQAGIEC